MRGEFTDLHVVESLTMEYIESSESSESVCLTEFISEFSSCLSFTDIRDFRDWSFQTVLKRSQVLKR